jgi:hypothetical protein
MAVMLEEVRANREKGSEKTEFGHWCLVIGHFRRK